MAVTGVATVSFGVAGTSGNEANVVVSGQSGIATNSFVEAWLNLTPTSDHSLDELRIENIQVKAGNIVAGTSFTIYAEITKGVTYGQYTINWVWT